MTEDGMEKVAKDPMQTESLLCTSVTLGTNSPDARFSQYTKQNVI